MINIHRELEVEVCFIITMIIITIIMCTLVHVGSGDRNRKGFSACLAHKMSIHTKLFESHLPPVTHTRHAGKHGFQGNLEAPFLDDGSGCRVGGH